MALVHFSTRKQALIASIEADVLQFMEHWEQMHKVDPIIFPAELDEDDWIAQFWAWMEGRI